MIDDARLEQFRSVYLASNELFQRHDWRALFSGLPEDFEWHPFAQVIDEGVARGPEGVIAMFERLVEVFPDWQAEPRDFLAAPGDRIVVILEGHGTGRASGIGNEGEFTQVWELQDGAPRRVREYPSREEGLRAAGLSPEA